MNDKETVMIVNYIINIFTTRVAMNMINAADMALEHKINKEVILVLLST